MAIKHKDIVSTRKGYSPVYIVNDERTDATWRTFIPHDNFYELLNKLLDIFEGKKKRSALWLQGAYGTGKSHACGVVKHLFGDEISEIEEYVNSFEKESLKQRVLGFRKRNRFLTIALKGEENLPKPEYMEYILKEKIREEAKKRFGINLAVETDIDKITAYLKDKDESWFQNKFKNSSFENLETLIKNLKELDESALDETLTVLSKEGIIFLKDFKNWLREALSELKEKGISGIFIIWDEFTSLLQEYEGYATRLQNILAENKEIYILIVTHKTYEYYTNKLDKDALNKIKDRFEFHHYKMEELTTFYILSKVLEKKNKQLWEKIVAERWNDNTIKEVDQRIGEFLNTRRTLLKELYPFHPFTAFLITYTVTHFLSANRSIFDFLYDPEKGTFQFFLEKNIHEEPFLTTDYLWDFFQRAINEDIAWESARGVSNTYKRFEEKVKQKGEQYLKVFKAILILNLLMKDIDEPISFLRPNKSNLTFAFAATPIKEELDEILNWIDEEGIIRKDTEGNFIIDERDLPQNEVRNKKAYLKNYYNEISKVLGDTDQEKEIEVKLNSQVLRDIYLHIDTKDKSLRGILNSLRIKEPYKLKVILGIPTTESDIIELNRKYEELSPEFTDFIFIIVKDSFNRELDRYIDFKAKEEVARSYGRAQDAQYYERQAENMLNEIIRKISNDNVYIFHEREKEERNFSGVSEKLHKISKRIFSKGAENLPRIKVKTAWDGKVSQQYLRKILDARNLRELEKESRGLERILLEALKNSDSRYIIDEEFRLKDTECEHPFVFLYNEISRIFNQKDKVYAEDFIFLREPPFGVYDKKLYGLLLGTIFRSLKDNLFCVGKGKSNTSDLEKFLETVLKDKKKGQEIILRLGSELDRKLLAALKELFAGILIKPADIDEIDDLNSLRVKVRKTIKEEIKWPLWVLSYSNKGKKLQNVIEKISEFLIKHDEELSDEEKKELLELISSSSLKINLRHLIAEQENFNNGIYSLVKQETGASEDTIEKIVEKLPQYITNESNFWEKTYVKEKIREINQNLLKSYTSTLNIVRDPHSVSSFTTNKSYTTTSTDQVEAIQDNIDKKLSTLSKEELLNIIQHLIRLHPGLTEEIEKLLER